MGTGAGATPGVSAVWLLATFGSIAAIASMADRIPLPIAVRRPVVRLCKACRSSCRSVVGAWTISAKPENATMPIWLDDPWLSMNWAAAASAAPIRLGRMSVEHMLPETSMVRMIVAWLVGTLAMTTGRARATARPASASANRANGRWRRTIDERGRAARMRTRLE